MKALILAAGFGTRLKPYTDKLPKPLFPVAGTVLIDITIAQLAAAGCDQLIINTHHLADQLEAHLDRQAYPVPIMVSHEPEILGTGGAVQKASPYLGEEPFWVVNSDILHNIPLAPIYTFHLEHPDPVTLVLIDDPNFNTVWSDSDRYVHHFQKPSTGVNIKNGRWTTFSGIQVVDPSILEYIPPRGFFSIIDAYRSLINTGRKIRGYYVKEAEWQDLGAPDRFQKAISRKIAPRLLSSAKENKSNQIEITPLAGDGSDRGWSRLSISPKSVILCEHGITMGPGVQEVDAFIAIGEHLYRQGIRVPKILKHDRFSGQVYLEDLGDIHLQTLVARQTGHSNTNHLYETVVQQLFKLATEGAKGFDPAWTYQTSYYDKNLILDKECRYFLEAFINGWCGRNESWATYATEFGHLADAIVAHGIEGLIHRDMQSRNVMFMHGKDPYFIDFQGARFGPVQYDLASLLIDPYVDLSAELRSVFTHNALTYYAEQLGCDFNQLKSGFTACVLSRNLQILGAFANLSQNKGKTAFGQYIPKAFEQLQWSLEAYKKQFGKMRLVRLERIVAMIKDDPQLQQKKIRRGHR